MMDNTQIKAFSDRLNKMRDEMRSRLSQPKDNAAALTEQIAELRQQLIDTQKAIVTGDGAEALAAALVDEGKIALADVSTSLKSSVTVRLDGTGTITDIGSGTELKTKG